MQIILYIIIISLLVAGGFLLAFLWAVRDGQYEDDYTPSMRLLVDDDMLLPVDNEDQNKELLSGNKTENDRKTDF